MREIVHIQAGQCGNQIGAKVIFSTFNWLGCHLKIFLKHLYSSGKSSLTSTVLTPPDLTTALLSFNWNASMSTTMRLPVANMYPALFWLIWNLAPWIPYALDLSDKCSVPTTLFSDNPALETIGPKVTTQKELNWLIQSLMLSAKNQNLATACKDSN